MVVGSTFSGLICRSRTRTVTSFGSPALLYLPSWLSLLFSILIMEVVRVVLISGVGIAGAMGVVGGDDEEWPRGGGILFGQMTQASRGQDRAPHTTHRMGLSGSSDVPQGVCCKERYVVDLTHVVGNKRRVGMRSFEPAEEVSQHYNQASFAKDCVG